MRQIKFREWLGKEFHYWGFLRDGAFIGPSDPKGIHNQFTGLLDKEGREIYDGDIMEFLDENWLVIYFEQYASFMLQKGNDLANITTQEEKIGNIYENPDLFK